ncbi:serpin B [Pseudobutyrivibrio sp. AR14]|uniref:serpin family protein n=1 Tax=Pseudobutyrivibrio sp. AR14 TaxID=1520804 RepID=UPI00088D03D1|nr:serpin family protein [Pseudobutyrivibrio sp. AR14]SCY24652.1 serpin B [Pseudobutyrivibrio sp. AR14]
MKKRIISLLLVGMMTASLATACGKGNEPEPEKPNSSNETLGELEHKPVDGDVAGIAGMNDFNSQLIAYVGENGYEKENYMISPTSYKAALCLAVAGANGQTQDELLKAMGFQSVDEMNAWYSMVYNETVDFNDSLEAEKENIAEIQSDPDMADYYTVDGEPDGAFRLVNSIWANEDGNPEFTQEYIDLAKEMYSAPATTVPGADLADAVNSWVSDATDGLINSITNDMSSVDLALVNALYLRAGWVDSFPEGGTVDDDFTTIDSETVTKSYMCKQDDTYYYEDENGKLIILPLDYGVKAAFVLGEIDDIDTALKEATEYEVDIKLPKLDMESEFGSSVLIGYLKSQGVELAFDKYGSADFSTMSTVPVYISDIIQKTRIKTDEEGLEAAAVTAIMMTESAAMPEEKEVKTFYATEPFKFFVYTELENEENEILFYGQMVK